MKHLLIAAACLSLAAGAAAQERRWEIEGYAGVLAAQPASAGSLTLPPPGAPLVTSTPTFPARAVSSWFFGDGAHVLNGVLQEFGPASRITPLDPLFAPLPAAHPAVFGLRVRRRLTPRLALEGGIDGFVQSSIRGSTVATALRASLDSFGPAFTDLFASGPFVNTTVSSQAAIVEGTYEEAAFTGTLNRDVGHLGSLQPYLAIGAGIVRPRDGFVASAGFAGRYRTSIAGEVPIDETDHVSIRITRPASAVAVLGGGVRHDFSHPWSVRVDARVLVGRDTTSVRLDAAPAVTRGTPAGFIESFTNPAVQFSNDPASGRQSSLSGASLQDVEVFKGGWLARTIVSVGVSRRF